jgi:quinol-cytochrome oxidoreductase complex cytochrome b subunit
MRSAPPFLLHELFAWTVALAVHATLAALFPWEQGEKADPYAPAFKHIRPEWYFLFMFESLKLVPGGEVAGVEYEAIPILLFGLAGLALVLVPFYERRWGRGRGFAAAGVAALAYVVGMTAWGYRSLVPVWVVAATGLLIVVMGLGTRHPPEVGGR